MRLLLLVLLVQTLVVVVLCSGTSWQPSVWLAHENETELDIVVRLSANSSAALVAQRSGYAYAGHLFGAYHVFRTHTDAATSVHTHARRAADSLRAEHGAEWHEVQWRRNWVRRDLFSEPRDVGVAQQWFLSGDAVSGNQRAVAHINVRPVWELGYQGRGVMLCVVDDGVNYRHSDLAANYNASLSYDYVGRDADPIPSCLTCYGNHGTPVASTCCGVNNRAVANNGTVAVANECGVGSAPRASFAAITNSVRNSDAQVAQFVLHRLSDIQIYVITTGPTDDGRSSQSVGTTGEAALLQGVAQGRGGKGAIYMWSAGNGGQWGDDCNYDGFVSHRTTVAVGAITALGKPTYYSEECAALHVVAPSSGEGNMARGGYAGMYAADIQSCSDNWGGTSGAAPLAAGVVALWLEAVPALTWLDVQGVMVYSSSRARTAASHATSWAYNGAGVPFSHWFGFGVIDAMKGLTVARQWVSYSDLQETTSGVVASTATFSSTQLLSVSWSCQAPNTRRVKSVDVAVVARHGRRGDLRVSLVSPHGTRCQLARPRPLDSSSLGLNNRFVCNAFWDEKPTGIWRLEIADTKANPAGALQSYRITVFHTAANVFSDVTTRPVSPDRPPNAITVFQPTVIVSAPGAFQTPAPSGAAVPYTLVDASSGGWRFRVGPLHANEVAQWRFADVEYGEMSGPTGSVWQSGAAPFGYAEASLRESFTFATPLANTTTSAIFRKEFFLSAAQIALISRFVLYSASDDYATVFVNGLPLLGEAPPALARNMAYWNEQKEFGRSVVRTGVNMIAVQVFNRNGSRDMGMDLRLDAVLLPGAAGSFPAPMPIPTPAPSPGTRISVIAVTDPLGSAVTDRSGAPVTSVITLPDFTDFFSADDTTEPAPLPTPENAALPYALGSSVPYLLFVLIGIAFCCVCVVILLAVVYLVRSRRGRQRRVLQRGRSRTRVTDYDGEVEREMGRKSDTTATKTPPALERKPTVADLPAAPHKDRPLPGVQPVSPQRATPDAEPKKLEQFASARDSPQVRRKTTVLPPLTAGATAPPAAEEPAPVDRPAARTPAGGSPVGTPQPARRAAAATAAVPAAAMGTPPASRRAVTGAPAPKLGYVDLDASGVLHDSLPEDISLDALDVPPPPFDETLQFERGGSQLKQSVAAESGDEDDDDDGSWNEQLPPVPADFT